MEYIGFCGLKFRGYLKENILKNSDHLKHVVTVGADFIIEAYKNGRMMQIINDNYSTFDGHLPYLLARLKYPKIKIEKIAGADFIYDICEYCLKENKKIFLLGGFPDSNKLSIDKLSNLGISSLGYVTGFIKYPFEPLVLEAINEKLTVFKPHIIFVALGMPKQEYWIQENKEYLESIGVEIAIGCGGTLEVFSGKILRAPHIIQTLCLEGFYRFIKEPNAIRFKRFIKTFNFLRYVFK